VLTLRSRGQTPPAWRVGSFGLGVGLLVVAVASPIDHYGEESSQAFHMVQHILIGDLAPLAIVAGLTGPILRPLLAFIHPLRRLFHPVAAFVVWALLLTFWHIPFMYEAALDHMWVHALEHICFFAGGTLIWVPLLETLQQLRTSREHAGNFVSWRVIPGREAEWSGFPAWLDPRLVRALQSRGINSLYSQPGRSRCCHTRGRQRRRPDAQRPQARRSATTCRCWMRF